jgi:hypothetical protein
LFVVFVGELMSCLCSFCLLRSSGVQHVLCCVFDLFVFVLLCCQFFWIVHFCIALSVFSNDYLVVITIFAIYLMDIRFTQNKHVYLHMTFTRQ